MPTIRPISAANKTKRIQYCEARRLKTIKQYWKYVYFTDEAHFRSRDLSAQDHYNLHIPNTQQRLERLDERKPCLDITVHVAAGISYDSKGVFLFYNDPEDPAEKQVRDKRRKPRKRKTETEEQFQDRVKEWEAYLPPQIDIRPKGNSMTQAFYTENVLKHHIDHIKKLEARYSHDIYFQEDNDNSHGTRSIQNVARSAKDSSRITTLIHPPQSPDLNPIEAIWRIMKQRLRGRMWTSVQHFKDDIEGEWKRVKLSSIRKRIAEMKWRCNQCIKLDGKRIRSKLW